MYDDVTAALIARATTLTGIEPATLPQWLTRAYADVATLRLRLTEGRIELNKLPSELEVASRLAETYESIAATESPGEERRAAAFVAASAHHLLQRADIAFGRERNSAPHITPNAISASIAAVLLYLASGYQSDAAELAGSIVAHEENEIARLLVVAIKSIASGALLEVARIELPRLGRDQPDTEIATIALYRELLRGLIRLARELLGEAGDARGEFPNSDELFRTAAAASVETTFPTSNEFASSGSAISTYPGPHHLARLLTLAGETMRRHGLVNVPPPQGVPPEGWTGFVRRMGLERPFLWENHLTAIESGYLGVGHSAVVAFPTGSGKSTLSELKIAGTLLGGRRVIFLAPTRALVWQVSRDLTKAFPNHAVRETLTDDGAYDETLSLSNADVSVMTPERCLTILGSTPEAFGNVGLLVFDECHLLHSTSYERNRRSVDAMLCLLGILDSAPEADMLLMSAMINNTDDLALWIADATRRPCFPLSITWKPTRQARGCLVFPLADLRNLMTQLQTAKENRTTIGAPVTVRRAMTVRPLALFALTQRWHPTPSAQSYALLPLLDQTVTLAVNARWELTPNKNKIAQAVAIAFAKSGTKTIIFLQDKDACVTLARDIGAILTGAAGRLDTMSSLTDDEINLVRSAADDLGGADLVIGPLLGSAAVHHGLLLPSERRLNESCFARRGGTSVIVATPTIAQGMNLPAEAVIIVGDMRFDPAAGGRVGMAAHELLNAAGRAGRAGHFASGVVLVIPDDLVGASSETEVRGAWLQLQQRAFGTSDQCLTIRDPVEMYIDRIQEAEPLMSRAVRYFLHRMPVHESDSDTDAAARRLLGKSMAAFFARQRGQSASFERKVERVLVERRELQASSERVQRLERTATALGLPFQRVRQIDRRLASHPILAGASVSDVLNWLFQFLNSDRSLLAALSDSRRLKAAFSKDAREAFETTEEVSPPMLSEAWQRLEMWINGNTLWEIELSFSSTSRRTNHCKSARDFLVNAIPEFAYVAGAVSRVCRSQIESGHEEIALIDVPLALGSLSACIREGLNSPEKLRLRTLSDPFASRKSVYELYEMIQPFLEPGQPDEVFSTCAMRVDAARDRWLATH
jgi:superfamily II DNA/RNA helicase